MPLKPNAEAVNRYYDRALLEENANLLPSELPAVIIASEADVLYCTEGASQLKLKRGGTNLLNLVKGEQKRLLKSALYDKADVCVVLNFRRKAFALVSYLSDGLFSAYIFVINENIVSSVIKDLRRACAYLEVTEKFAKSAHGGNVSELKAYLKRQIERMESYIGLYSDAAADTPSPIIDITRLTRLMCEFSDSFFEASGCRVLFHGGDMAAVRAKTSVFGRVFSAVFSFMVSQTENFEIEVGVKREGKNVVISFVTPKNSLPDNAELSDFIISTAHSLGWEARLSYNSTLNNVVFDISIPDATQSDGVVRSDPLTEKLYDISPFADEFKKLYFFM